jgi:purine-binding chemotaxis protein CheW
MTALAHRSPAAASPPAAQSPSTQYLTFSLGSELFALDIRGVREIIQYGTLTTVPLMPRFLCGVINLRGAVVPVIDLQVRFGRAPAAVGKKTCIVIFDGVKNGERTELGLMVDAVSEVVDIEPGQIDPPPSFGAPVARDFIRGMGRLRERLVILVDPSRAFDVEEMAQICATALETVAA